MRKRAILIAFFMVLVSMTCAFCAEEATVSPAKFNFTNDPEEDLIFMKLRRTLFTKVRLKVAQDARFGIAEYYFKHNDLSDAYRDFKAFAGNYPPGESTLLARVYLYKIALIKKDADLASSLKKDIFGSPFLLLFSKFKTLKFKSPFNNNYEIHYYLDKIKIFLNGEVFEELNP